MSTLRACGRHYGTEDEASRAKKVIAETHEAAWCFLYQGWHLAKVTSAPKATARKPPADNGPDRATRALVLARDGFACVCCGTSIVGQHYSLGHRLRASQGGKPVPSNLLTFLGLGGEMCHGRIDGRRDPEDEEKGYTVRSGKDPRLVAVEFFTRDGGFTRYLADDGDLLEYPPGQVA